MIGTSGMTWSLGMADRPEAGGAPGVTSPADVASAPMLLWFTVLTPDYRNIHIQPWCLVAPFLERM